MRITSIRGFPARIATTRRTSSWCFVCSARRKNEARPRCLDHRAAIACKKPRHDRVIVRMHDAKTNVMLLRDLEGIAGEKMNQFTDEKRLMKLSSYSIPEGTQKKKKKRARVA